MEGVIVKLVFVKKELTVRCLRATGKLSEKRQQVPGWGSLACSNRTWFLVPQVPLSSSDLELVNKGSSTRLDPGKALSL